MTKKMTQDQYLAAPEKYLRDVMGWSQKEIEEASEDIRIKAMVDHMADSELLDIARYWVQEAGKVFDSASKIRVSYDQEYIFGHSMGKMKRHAEELGLYLEGLSLEDMDAMDLCARIDAVKKSVRVLSFHLGGTIATATSTLEKAQELKWYADGILAGSERGFDE